MSASARRRAEVNRTRAYELFRMASTDGAGHPPSLLAASARCTSRANLACEDADVFDHALRLLQRSPS